VKITLHVWRQADPTSAGRLETYTLPDVSPESSFLEMFDELNETLVLEGKEPVAFSHDCREGICGSCAMMINGAAHGPMKGAATCQLHMRSFKDGDEIVVEPWRARAFPIIKDLVVDRSALDRVIQAGGFISANTGGARDANEISSQARRRRRDGRGRVHRLRRVRGGVPERVGVAVHGRQGLAPRAAAAGAAGALPARRRDGRTDGPRGVRPLHLVRRVPGGVPEAHLDRRDLAHEPRLPARVAGGQPGAAAEYAG
jgi:hypothetical protein